MNIDSNQNKLVEKYEITFDYALENHDHVLNMSVSEAQEVIRALEDEIKKFGNINLKAAEEIANRKQEFEDKKAEYTRISEACLTLEKIINELDAKAIASFSSVIDQANAKLPDIFKYLFGGGSCEIVYEDPDKILESGIEIRTHLPGKTITNMMLFSGGEKTLIALSVLFAVLQVSALPLVILDEAESALDPGNVERFASIIRQNSHNTQFITITHREGTMSQCDVLYGVTMMTKGVSIIAKMKLNSAQQYIKEKQDK